MFDSSIEINIRGIFKVVLGSSQILTALTVTKKQKLKFLDLKNYRLDLIRFIFELKIAPKLSYFQKLDLFLVIIGL